MPYTSQTDRTAGATENGETFHWRGLQFHVVTPDPMTREQVDLIRKATGSIASVGRFADLLGIVFGRHVTIRGERPSTDIRFEVGR